DGIRDSSVTGVQTCALPIFAASGSSTHTLYDVPNVSIIGSASSASDPWGALFTSRFQALPIYDSFSGMSYARARWLNHEQGQFKIGRASCRERVELVVRGVE